MASTNLTRKCVATGFKLTEGFPTVHVFGTIQISFIGERFLKITVSCKFVAMVRFTCRLISFDVRLSFLIRSPLSPYMPSFTHFQHLICSCFGSQNITTGVDSCRVSFSRLLSSSSVILFQNFSIFYNNRDLDWVSF